MVEKHSIMLTLLLLLMATASFTLVSAHISGEAGKGQGPPSEISFFQDEANIRLSTQNFTVNFAGRSWQQVPKFQYWYTSDEDTDTIYQVFFHKVFEFDDRDGDGVFNASLGDKMEQMFALPSGNQSFEGPEYILDGEEVIGVHFNFTIHDRNEGLAGDIELILHCQLYNETQTLVGPAGTICNVTGSAELKIDVILYQWPFKDDDNRLCLQWSVNQQDETVTPAWDDVNHIVTLGGGYFKWLSHAVVDGDVKPVNCSFTLTGNTVHLDMCYPNFKDKTLIHDPSIGVFVDTMPPTIHVNQAPATHVPPDESAALTIDAVDETSGVKSLLVMYSIDDGDTWNAVASSPSDGQYVASLPTQQEGTTVQYYIIATDVAGNQEVSAIHTYYVGLPILDSWIIYGLAFIAIAIVVVAYYKKQPPRYLTTPYSP